MTAQLHRMRACCAWTPSRFPLLAANAAMLGVQDYQLDWEAILCQQPETFVTEVSRWLLPPAAQVSASGNGHTGALQALMLLCACWQSWSHWYCRRMWHRNQVSERLPATCFDPMLAGSCASLKLGGCTCRLRDKQAQLSGGPGEQGPAAAGAQRCCRRESGQQCTRRVGRPEGCSPRR